MSVQPKFGFILEYVTNIEAARRFYEDVLGFQVERYHPVFVQFNNHFAIASDKSLTGSRAPEVYWLVDDAEAAFKELSSKAEIMIPLKQAAYGRVFAIKDPAGWPLFLLEFSRDRPSTPAE